MADQCIVCLESLDVHPLVVPPLQESDLDVHVPHDTAGAPAAAAASTSASDSTLPVSVAPAPTTPTKTTHAEYDGVISTSTPDGFVVNEDSRIAEIEVCGHVLHDVCLRQWTGKANSCPICRQTFNSVIVYDRVGGQSIPALINPQSMWNPIANQLRGRQQTRLVRRRRQEANCRIRRASMDGREPRTRGACPAMPHMQSKRSRRDIVALR